MSVSKKKTQLPRVESRHSRNGPVQWTNAALTICTTCRPTPEGLENVLTMPGGLFLNFEIYQGKEQHYNQAALHIRATTGYASKK